MSSKLMGYFFKFRFFFRELISKRHTANSLKVSYVDFAELSLHVVVAHLVTSDNISAVP